jgi:hypothetical protein
MAPLSGDLEKLPMSRTRGIPSPTAESSAIALAADSRGAME